MNDKHHTICKRWLQPTGYPMKGLGSPSLFSLLVVNMPRDAVEKCKISRNFRKLNSTTFGFEIGANTNVTRCAALGRAHQPCRVVLLLIVVYICLCLCLCINGCKSC